MEMNIKEMSLQELKALAYDQMAQIQLCQNNLQMLNTEIDFRNFKNSKNEEKRINPQ